MDKENKKIILAGLFAVIAAIVGASIAHIYNITSIPDESDWIDKGDDYSSMRQYQEAIECYKNAIDLNVKSKNAWFKKGVAYHNIGEYNDAIEAYDNVIELDPGQEFAIV